MGVRGLVIMGPSRNVDWISSPLVISEKPAAHGQKGGRSGVSAATQGWLMKHWTGIEDMVNERLNSA